MCLRATSPRGDCQAQETTSPEVTVKPKKPPVAKVTPKPAEKPAPKPAQIIIETSPNAEVYLDDQFVGRASPQGRLVIANPKAGDHGLRVSLTGKRDYEAKVTVVAGQETRIEATLEELAPAAGAVKENPKDGLKYVWIPPGSFMMGCSPGDSECSDIEKPSHRVTLSKGFWLGQTEVTVGAYKRFARETGRAMPEEPERGNNPLNPSWGNERMPVVNVSWDDAVAYCRWAGGRLPTEAEWEYAARAGSTEARYGAIDDVAWSADNSGRSRIDSARIWSESQQKYWELIKANWNTMHEVGQKRRNAWSLYDMLGNVWEWVNDWYDENYYQNSPSQDPSGASSGKHRTVRGGSWMSPQITCLSLRASDPQDNRYEGLGLRCVREVAP